MIVDVDELKAMLTEKAHYGVPCKWLDLEQVFAIIDSLGVFGTVGDYAEDMGFDMVAHRDEAQGS